MTHDTECPYCGMEITIDHDGGYGCNEDEKYEQECDHCEKIFVYTISIYFYYDIKKAPCKNGEEHNWKKIFGVHEKHFQDRYRCTYCDEEITIKKGE